jgi:hypothetical protein
VNDLKSRNPELKAIDREVKSMHSSNYYASCTPVTDIDFCDRILETPVFSVKRYGCMDGGVLGKNNAWKDVVDALHEHAVQVQSDKHNKYRRTKDLLFKVPVIGHVISTNEDEVHQSISWPILNGKACVPMRHCIALHVVKIAMHAHGPMTAVCYRYDPSRLYVRQGTVLLPFGCTEFHPLPVAPAQREAEASCNDAAQAFAVDWKGEAKVNQTRPEH